MRPAVTVAMSYDEKHRLRLYENLKPDIG